MKYDNVKNRNPHQVLKPFLSFQPSKKQFISNPLTPRECCTWTSITIVVVTEIMCLSRRWWAGQVSYRICNPASSRFTRFGRDATWWSHNQSAQNLERLQEWAKETKLLECAKICLTGQTGIAHWSDRLAPSQSKSSPPDLFGPFTRF
jgi:hypothetical protein